MFAAHIKAGACQLLGSPLTRAACRGNDCSDAAPNGPAETHEVPAGPPPGPPT
jgi:hypothetical protein